MPADAGLELPGAAPIAEHVGVGAGVVVAAGEVAVVIAGVVVVVVPGVVPVVPGVVAVPAGLVVAVPPGVVEVPPTVAVAPGPAVHDPVVGVATGVVDVSLGVVMTSTLGDAGLVPAEPVELSVVETVVVSVRPWVEAGMSGVVAGCLAATGTVAAALLLAPPFAACFGAIDFNSW